MFHASGGLGSARWSGAPCSLFRRMAVNSGRQRTRFSPKSDLHASISRWEAARGAPRSDPRLAVSCRAAIAPCAENGRRCPTCGAATVASQRAAMLRCPLDLVIRLCDVPRVRRVGERALERSAVRLIPAHGSQLRQTTYPVFPKIRYTRDISWREVARGAPRSNPRLAVSCRGAIAPCVESGRRCPTCGGSSAVCLRRRSRRRARA
jgi:hypothetical protein